MDSVLQTLERVLGLAWEHALTILVVACAIAVAMTPIAFVLMGRKEYLYTRRGRVYRKPEWWSVVCSMGLVMGVPGILGLLIVKSQSYDADRYSFDPNRTLSVLDEGRQYEQITRAASVKQAGEAVRAELARLKSARDLLSQNVAALGPASGGLAAMAGKSPELGAQLAPVFEGLNRLREPVGLDEFDTQAVLDAAGLGKAVAESTDPLETARTLDAAVKQEMEKLAGARKGLVERVKKLDEQLIVLRAAGARSAELSDALKPVLERLSAVRRGIGLDAPQQLLIEDAAPVDLRKLVAALGPPVMVATAASNGATPPPAAPLESGLPESQREAELASVPEPQKGIAGLLPLVAIPDGWEVGKSGERHLETFNAENLYEKIDGRAESFLQYDVKGMAYAYYHPAGDPSGEVQLYVFEMATPLKALGKYGSEKPEEIVAETLGAEGYSSGASVFFHAKNLYTQIVATSDEPKFKEFALAIAKRVADELGASSTGGEAVATGEVSPETIFALLPEGNGKANPKYVAQDVFGYSFLSDAFMADYSAEGATWQGFIRTYPTAEEAKKVLDQYRAESESFGAKISEATLETADAAFLSENFGQYDLLFVKGNSLAGVNGATSLEPAKAFAEAFARGLASPAPFMPAEEKKGEAAGGEESY